MVPHPLGSKLMQSGWFACLTGRSLNNGSGTAAVQAPVEHSPFDECCRPVCNDVAGGRHSDSNGALEAVTKTQKPPRTTMEIGIVLGPQRQFR